jgi:DNA-binding transcriptional ArsR family regulator
MDRPALTPEQCAPVLRALAEPIRLRILSLLRDGPRTVGELTDRLGSRQYQTSRHLGALRELGLVLGERDGRHVRYRLTDRVGADGAAPTVELGCCQVRVE